ncbi:MAG: hypothetical protein RL141_882 [Candidatus Parcubacteria bacterium]|jgi:F-type H+-transporting ATPase subunit b
MTESLEPTHSTEVAEDTGVLGTLGINAPLFVAQLVNVAIVLAVLHFFVFKPLTKTLEARRKKIEEGVANAAEADTRLASAKTTEASLLANAKAAAHKTMDEARTAGDAERKARVDKAAEEIDQQVQDAKEKISTERTQAKEAVRREVAGLVLAATKKVTSGELDEAAHLREIERAVKELETATV